LLRVLVTDVTTSVRTPLLLKALLILFLTFKEENSRLVVGLQTRISRLLALVSLGLVSFLAFLVVVTVVHSVSGFWLVASVVTA